ncbi:MAG: DUF6178 family protein [Desulfatiglans sp.]|nr:DUF6178 family protein [Desulfatiglans sp.]
MPNQEMAGVNHTKTRTPVGRDQRSIRVRDLASLSGSETLNRILSVENPGDFIRELPIEDFFRLVKKVGTEESLALLELASVEQWQYLLDLEIWERDRIDISRSSQWMSLLEQANCQQLVKWVFSEGEYLAYYHFFRTVEVKVINDQDDAVDLPDGFFSLDGVFYVRASDPQYRKSMEHILREMADENLERYQAFLLGLVGMVPAEVEEEIYRVRNLRLGEHGFLPYEEAIGVYAPVDIEDLKKEEPHTLSDIIDKKEVRDMIPVLPLAQAETGNLFMEVTERLTDPILLDRLRLEFAGLANQILSADRVVVHEMEALHKACRKAARIANLAVERVCGKDLESAEKLLRRHSLLTLFRVGFGMTLKLKWEAERWLSGSWFHRQGLEPEFWGEHRGGILKGLLRERPKRYVGTDEGGELQDFEWVAELTECLEVLRGLMALDSLFEKLADSYSLEQEIIPSPEISFYPLLFNLWARLLLKMEPSFSGITLDQAKSFFSQLRDEPQKPPYRMDRGRRVFLNDLLTYSADGDPEASSILEDALSRVWDQFHEEYEYVSLTELDGRHSTFVTIEGG